MKEVKAFLAQLSREMQRAEDFDIEARQLLDELHKDVDRMEVSGDTQFEPVLGRLRALESKFASTHPALERLARELADAIVKMGV